MADRVVPCAMEGNMNRKTLLAAFPLSASMLICGGCAGRMNADLLQARIREQTAQITESQRELAKTRSELNRVRQESEQLKSELAQSGRIGAASMESILPISKIRIHSLTSGGLNKDDQPGDDAVVIQFVPVNSANETAQVPGQVEFTLIDPLLPDAERQLGHWIFSAEECQKHWTRGITTSGYQFSLPLEHAPLHTELVVHVQYRTLDQRRLDANQIVKVILPANSARSAGEAPAKRPRPLAPQSVDEADEFLPPVGENSGRGESDEVPPVSEADAAPTTSGRAILHSSNWTDATIPQLR
jgi:hypothetical protein